MLALFFSLYNNDVCVVLQAIMKHIVENNSHGPLIGGASVLESKRYDPLEKGFTLVQKAIFSASVGTILMNENME